MICLYCLQPHDRNSTGCCPEHARKVGASKAVATRQARRTLAEVLARANHRVEVRPHFRQLALGVGDPREHVRAIFGVSEIPPMRDTSL